MQTQTLEGFRLSPQQKRLWSLQQDSCVYRAQCVLVLEGNLKPDILKEAFRRVIDRHDILRTVFHRQPGRKVPIQIICNSFTLSWNHFSLDNVEPKDWKAEIEKIFQEQKNFVFSFEQSSILRLSLAKLSSTRYILFITLPSLYADSWTIKNLVKELSYVYEKCLNNEKLTDEVVQYIQFSEWQNELLEADVESGQTYWHQQNFDSLKTPTLPFERASSRKVRFEPNIYALSIEPTTVEKLEAIANLYDTKISEFLLACWQTLLWRLIGHSDITVSTVFHGRKYEDLQDTLGLLAKWLPVCCSFQDNYKFTEILSQVSEILRNHDQWQEYYLWENTTGSTSDIVELPISFEFDEWPAKCNSGGVLFSIEEQYICFERFKVKLTCVRTEESLKTEFHYDPELINLEGIEYVAEQFQTLLENVLKNPDARISELEVLSERQRQQLIVEFNKTQTDYSQKKYIHGLFEAQVEKTPDDIAVLFEDQQLTYADLNRRANQLAHYLQNLGVGLDVLVGIYLERSPDIAIAILGILKAGGAYLPLDAALPKEDLAFRLQDTQIPILLTQQSLVDRLPDNLAKIVCLDEDSEVIAQESFENPTSRVTGENLVYVLFTSGSTGKSKGVAIEHLSLLNYLQGILDRLNLPPSSSFATFSTFAADLGNTAIFPALCTGGCLLMVSQEWMSNPEALAEYFRHHPIDCLKIVPSHLAALLTSSAMQSILPRQRLVLGGEAASWKLIEQIKQLTPNCQVINHYGPTETTVGVLTYLVNDKLESYSSQTVPIGRPLANAQVYVVDTKLRPVPVGVPGELYIGGVGLARGYLNRPELTAERFITNPFTDKPQARLYKTGDLVRYLPDGNLEFLGRTDNQVKIRGFRIELEEIESLLGQHPGVRQSVVSVWEEEENKRLVAYIVPNKQQQPSVSDLRGFLAEKRSEYMIPGTFVFLKTIPLMPNGKVARQLLPAPNQARPELAETFVAPRNEAERTLATIWQEMLQIEKVGIHDNFFELGGHSLLVVQVHSKLQGAFGREVSITDLFKYPTISSLAGYLNQEQNEQLSLEKVQEQVEERLNSRRRRAKLRQNF